MFRRKSAFLLWRRQLRGDRTKLLLARGSQEVLDLEEGSGSKSSMAMDSTGQSLEVSWPDSGSC